jgi:hypothetical protein
LLSLEKETKNFFVCKLSLTVKNNKYLTPYTKKIPFEKGDFSHTVKPMSTEVPTAKITTELRELQYSKTSRKTKKELR